MIFFQLSFIHLDISYNIKSIKMKKILLVLLFVPFISFSQEKSTDKKANENIHWIVTVDIKDGYFDKLDGLIERMKEYVNTSEPETIHYDFYYNEGKNKLFIYECYPNNETALRHMSSFSQNFEKPFSTAVENGAIQVFGPVNETFRAKMEKYNVTYWGYKR